MITKIELKGFKSYVDNTFELKPLTILTGLNSSGKSSVIQAIRIMENVASREYGDSHVWNLAWIGCRTCKFELRKFPNFGLFKLSRAFFFFV